MKSYIVAAYKFMEYAFEYIKDWELFDDEERIVEAMCYAEKKTHIHAQYACGSARHAIVADNFVIKWDRVFEGYWQQIGGCLDEVKNYDKARLAGFSHLFAKITPIYIGKKYFYIMPKIPYVGPSYHEYTDIAYYLTEPEWNWIKNIKDLHNYNWGLIDEKPVIIDYAYM